MATSDRHERPLRAVPDFEAGFSASLPVMRPALVGRASQLEAVRRALFDEQARLVTVTGPGGVGKTRLAVEAAAGLVPHFVGSVLFVSVESVATPDGVIEVIARASGTEGGGGVADPLERAAAALAERPALLVVDNLEHVPGAGAALTDLLERCPQLVVLATSRRPLHQPGERVIQIAPLGVPGSGPSPLDAARDSDAVTLFTAVARSVDESFVLTASNAGAVGEICRRLDGLPLALELAASRSRVLAPGQMAALLSSRLDVVKGAGAGGTDRPRTLWASIETSFELLTVVDQRRFRALGVFSGGFTAETLSTVTGDDIVEVLDTLSELDDLHLVRPAAGPADARRFDLLVTVRQFALAQLAAAGEGDELRDRHARWCLALAAPAEDALTGPDPAATLDLLELEHDNLRSALAWLVATNPGAAMRLGADLWRFWWIRGHLREGRRWLESAIGAAMAASTDATSERADAEVALADLLSELGDNESTVERFEGALTLYETLGDRRGQARCLTGLAIGARDRMALDESAGLLARAIDLFVAAGDRRGAAMALSGRAAVAYYRRDLADAEADWVRARAIAREVGDERAAASLLSNLGAVRLDMGDLAGAIRAHEESAAISRQLGDRAGLVQSLGNLGGVLVEAGQLERARGLIDEAVEIAAELGLTRNEAVLTHTSGTASLRGGDLAGAADATARGLELFARTGMSGAGDEARAQLAEIADRAGCVADRDYFADVTIDASDDDREIVITRARALAATIGARPATRADIAASARRAGLSAREAEVAELLVQRYSDAEIAAMHFISVRTVTTHVSAILRKLGITSRREVEAALDAQRGSMRSPPSARNT